MKVSRAKRKARRVRQRHAWERWEKSNKHTLRVSNGRLRVGLTFIAMGNEYPPPGRQKATHRISKIDQETGVVTVERLA